LSAAIIFSSCALDAEDSSSSETDSDGTSVDTTSTRFISVNIPDIVYSSGSRAASEVDIDSVSVSLRRSEGNEELLFKKPEHDSTNQVFSLQAEIPINTDLVIEAIGFNADDDVTAYGIRTLRITENEDISPTISMVYYQPVNLPIVKITSITKPPAAAVNSPFNINVSGYVLLSEWPDDPYGEAIKALDMEFSSSINSGTSYLLGSEQIKYADASVDRVSFSNIGLTLSADSTSEAAVALSAELFPGGTLVSNFTVPQMAPVTSLTAASTGAGGTNLITWTNPSGTWFDGVVLLASTSAIPQTYDAGTEIYNNTGTTYTHTGLTDEVEVYYSIFPYAEEGSARVYGAGRSVSATPHDDTPPDAVTGLTATESSGTVSLSWTNPASGFETIKVLRKTGSVPLSSTDASAVTVYSGGTAESCSNSITASGTFYYAVYAIDSSGNISSRTTTSVSYTVPVSGTVWGANTGVLSESDSKSVSRTYSYADTWVFTISTYCTVTIGMNGYVGPGSFDTYLYLYSGSTPTSGNFKAANDDSNYAGNWWNSRIQVSLSPGTYVIEATSFGGGVSGNYQLDLSKTN
jgi:hypothetical protein